MSASITLSAFARNPGKAISGLSGDGLIITRPDGPALRLSQAASSEPKAAPDAGSEQLADLAQRVLFAAPSEVFLTVIAQTYPWLNALPAAALRMAHADLVQAHEQASADQMETVLATWKATAATFAH